MAISASELVAYASANMPDDDESTSGGAIDDTIRVVFTPLAADDDIEVVSSSGSDTTQDVTVVARAPNGEVVTDTVTLNGITPVGFEFGTSGEAIERVLSVTMDGDAAGTVTVRRGSGGATVGTIPAGERGFRRLFINAASDPDTQTERYEKIFLKNTNTTLALLNAEVSESADPSGVITFALETSVDGTESTTDRTTAPSNVTAFGSTPITIDTATSSATANIAEGSAIGVWALMTLSAANAPIESTWTVELSGTST